MRTLFTIMLLLAFSADAANLRFTFVGTDGTVVVNSANLTAQQEDLLIDWLWAQYAPTDPETGAVLERTAQNEAEAYRRYARAIHAGTYAQARRWKREQKQAEIHEPNLPNE